MSRLILSLVGVVAVGGLLLSCRLLSPDAAGTPDGAAIATSTVEATSTATAGATVGATATAAATATVELQPSPTLAQTATPAQTEAATQTAVPATAAPATATPTPAQPQGVDQRISFAAGATSAAVENAVISGTRDRYTLWVQAGQTMRVEITSLEDNADFQVYAPDGQQLKGESAGAVIERWELLLPQSGDYVIVVGPTRGNATYRLVVSIPPLATTEPTRIQFAAGMTSATLQGELEAGGRALYVMQAAEDQHMTVGVTSPNEALVMGVSGADGTVFLPLNAERTDLQIVALPATMDYFIEVVSTGPATDYILVASASALADLPERIEFEAGETTATVAGTLGAGGDLDSYILRALGGQTITIDAMPEDAPLSVYLQSEDGADFFFAVEGRLVAELPRTLDYVLSISTPNAAGVTDYELQITIE